MKDKIKELLLSKNKDDFTLGVEILHSLGEDLSTDEWSEIYDIRCKTVGNYGLDRNFYRHRRRVVPPTKAVKWSRDQNAWILD